MKQGLMSTVLFAASVSLAPLVALGAPLVSPSAGSDVVLSMRATPAGELRLG
jgi:hypothetical protein